VAKIEPATLAKPEPSAPVTANAEPTHVPKAEALATKVPAAEPAAPAESLWAVDYPDGEDRELTLGEIEKELAAGTIDLNTLVWREGMDEWLELGQLPELRALPAAVAPARAPALPAPPPQRPKAPSAPAVETGLSTTLPQPNLAAPPQRPPAPSAPVIDFARHDPLKAAPPAPIPKPPPPFSTSRDSRPPTPPVFTPGVPTIPANTVPAFPVVAPAASIVAAPVPARANPSGVAPIANVEDWPQKNRTPAVIGVIVLLAVGGLAFFLTRSSGDELPPPVPISALPPSIPITPHATEPEPTAAPRTATLSQPSPGSNAAMQPPGSQPIATPNAGFAELFASGARSADEKSGVSGPAKRFDAALAKSALAAVANQTADCREKGGPTGKATVVVTFDPSGKVSSATVSDAPFAGTSSGACIAGTMKRATVPAFSGLPGTATQIISIQ
jgi:hypothetical protein